MDREDRRPATTKKLNMALSQIPASVVREFEVFARRFCLRVQTTPTGSKNSKAFKAAMVAFENWADGYATGAHCQVTIVSGIVNFPITKYDGSPDLEKHLMLFIVHDFKDLLKEIAEIAAVAEVQVS